MIKALLNLIILVLPFSELLRFEVFPNIYLRVLDILALGLLGLLVIDNPGKIIKAKNIWLFLGILVISNLANPFNPQSGLYLIRTIIYFSLIPFFLNPEPKLTLKNHQLLNLSLVVFVISGLLQYFWYPELRNLYYLGYDPHSYRWVGLFLDPNLSSLLLVWIIVYFWPQKNKLAKPIIALSLLSLLLTYSRIGWLSFLVGWIYMYNQKVLHKQNLKLILILFLLILMLPRYFGEGTNLLRTNSIFAKIESSQIVLKQLKTKPLLGIGYNNIHLLKSSQNEPIANNSLYGIDNSWLTVLITSGIIGLILFLRVIKQIGQKSEKLFKVLGVVYLVHSFSVNSFFMPTLLMFFLLFSLSLHKSASSSSE